MERHGNGQFPHLTAISRQPMAADTLYVAVTPGEPDGTHGLVGTAAIGASHAADRHAQFGTTVAAGTGHHLTHGFGADGAMILQGHGCDAEQASLGRIGISDVAGLEVGRTADDIGDRAGHAPSRAGFRGRYPNPALTTCHTQPAGELIATQADMGRQEVIWRHPRPPPFKAHRPIAFPLRECIQRRQTQYAINANSFNTINVWHRERTPIRFLHRNEAMMKDIGAEAMAIGSHRLGRSKWHKICLQKLTITEEHCMPAHTVSSGHIAFRYGLWASLVAIAIISVIAAGLGLHTINGLQARLAAGEHLPGMSITPHASKATLIGLALFAMVSAVTTAIALNHWLGRMLGADPLTLRARVCDIGANNLRSVDSNASVGSVTRALTEMTQSLSNTVNQVRRASHEVENGSEIVIATCDELLSRVEQQAATLSEIAAAMEQLGVTVEHNASRAGDVDSEALAVSRLATECDGRVTEVAEAMQELNARSEAVADIVSTIDNFAFQTNLLALNASVEAARAGEHGHGFAVVAQEVRRLATRSADASGQISQLIRANLEQVAQGTEMARQAGAKTRQSKEAMTRVTRLIGDINRSTVEQARAVREVSNAVSEMDSVTQRNATLVRRNAEAGKDLRRRSNQLGDAIATFDLDDDILQPRARTSQEASLGLSASGVVSAEKRTGIATTSRSDGGEKQTPKLPA